MKTTRFGGVTVSRFLLGSNPFSGFSHQSVDRDAEMVHWYTVARIKDVLREAERLGVTGIVARTDVHVIRTLTEYRDEGGKLQWFAQTCPEVGSSEACIRRAAKNGAVGCHIHGGVMDHTIAEGKGDEAKRAVDLIHELGLVAGVAGHQTRVFEWAAKNLDVDYFMCCHYNPTVRDKNPEHVHGAVEVFSEEDRQAMTALVQSLPKPVLHYKVLGSKGRNKPADAFKFCSKVVRPQDAVCVGVYTKDSSKQLTEDVALFEKHCAAK